jgi:hypothetical protein
MYQNEMMMAAAAAGEDGPSFLFFILFGEIF